jgi:hypothetical protein
MLRAMNQLRAQRVLPQLKHRAVKNKSSTQKTLSLDGVFGMTEDLMQEEVAETVNTRILVSLVFD